MNCKFCNRRKQVSLICIKDESKMCESCSEQHIRSTGHSKYIMNYVHWFKKQNESETLRLSCSNSLKKSLSAISEDLQKKHFSVESLLKARRDQIESIINKAAEDQIKKVTQNRDRGKQKFEQTFHMLYSKNPSASGLAHVISSLSSEEEVNNLVFSEIVKPECLSEVDSLIRASLSIKHHIYTEAKPILIPYLRPGSQTACFYDVLHEKVISKNYINKKFALHAAWCFTEQFSLAFSGGYLDDTIRFEVFIINPYDMEIQPLPPLNIERYMHGMAYLNGVLYVFGGVSSEGHTSSIEKLVIGDEQWKFCGNMQTPKVKMSVCAVGESIYLGDENNIEVFNPKDESCKIMSVFEKSDYYIMTAFKDKFFILKKNKLFCVIPEPSFVTKKINDIPLTEYYTEGQSFLIFGKIYFLLDVNKTVHSLNLGNWELKALTNFGLS